MGGVLPPPRPRSRPIGNGETSRAVVGRGCPCPLDGVEAVGGEPLFDVPRISPAAGGLETKMVWKEVFDPPLLSVARTVTV